MGPLTAALCASLFIQGLVVVLFLRFLSGDREQHAQALSALLVQAQEQADAQARERRELYQRIQAPEVAVQMAAVPERVRGAGGGGARGAERRPVLLGLARRGVGDGG
jgi:hypothetical protein